MLTTILLTVIILVICVVLLAVKVIFKKGGRFPNTHVGGNRALGKKVYIVPKHKIVNKRSKRICMIE